MILSFSKQRWFRLVGGAIAFAIFALGLVACNGERPSNSATSSSSSLSLAATPNSTASKAALCNFVSDIDSAAREASTAGQKLQVLRQFAPRFDSAIAAAPAPVKAQIITMVQASRTAIQTNNVAGIGSEDVSDAGYRLDNYCGIKN
jgi:hypothetical protein